MMSYTGDYHFSKDDIYANRSGKLTPEQEDLVASIYQSRQRGANQTIIALIVFFFVLMVLGFGVEFNQWDGTVSEFVAKQSPIFLMVIGGFTGILTFSIIVNYVLGHDMRRRHIQIAEGAASIVVKQEYSKGTYTRYELTLKKGLFRSQLFRFSSETALRQFQAGKHYRLYYMQYRPFPIVLSAEEL
jgi:hypothetical protein